MKDKSITEHSFNAFDSTLEYYELTIPEGYKAEIKEDKVIIRRKLEKETEK